MHHFADDTNLLYVGKSIKELNKLVNYDLKNLLYWLHVYIKKRLVYTLKKTKNSKIKKCILYLIFWLKLFINKNFLKFQWYQSLYQ